MKRLAAFLLAAAMVLTLAACGEGGLSLNPGGKDKSGEKEGYIGDTLSTFWFDFTVKEAYSCAKYQDYTAASGKKLVVATITLKNTCGHSVDMWGDDFVILWDDEDGAALALPAGVSSDQFPDEYTLGINQSKTAKAVYEVPEDFRDFAIAFQELFEDTDNPENLDGVEGDTFFVTFTAEEK